MTPKEEHILEEAKQRAKNYMNLKGALDSQYVDFSNPNADKITSASTTTIKEELKQIKCYCGHTTYCDCGPLEEPKQETHICKWCKAETWQSDDECYAKQETLEEAKLRQLFKNRSNCYADADDVIQAMDENCFIETIKEWQQERMYSEEEVLALLRKCHFVEQNIEELFEQFKKK